MLSIAFPNLREEATVLTSTITASFVSYLKLTPQDSTHYMFLINATVGGVRLLINNQKLIDAYFPQSSIFTSARALLPTNMIHKIELQYYSVVAPPRRLELLWRDLDDPNSQFTVVNKTYYSYNSTYII